jgi:hypothetical protein
VLRNCGPEPFDTDHPTANISGSDIHKTYARQTRRRLFNCHTSRGDASFLRPWEAQPRL